MVWSPVVSCKSLADSEASSNNAFNQHEAFIRPLSKLEDTWRRNVTGWNDLITKIHEMQKIRHYLILKSLQVCVFVSFPKHKTLPRCHTAVLFSKLHETSFEELHNTSGNELRRQNYKKWNSSNIARIQASFRGVFSTVVGKVDWLCSEGNELRPRRIPWIWNSYRRSDLELQSLGGLSFHGRKPVYWSSEKGITRRLCVSLYLRRRAKLKWSGRRDLQSSSAVACNFATT